MISDARGSHVSPGIYTEERDATYSVKSLGITNLGLVGETLYGPAFQNIEVEDWSSFVDYFGGTSPEKFKGSGLPKYELPYIAKSYLEKSKQLNVVRVLGLSGYQAGPVWVLTTTSGSCGPLPLVVFRSKMTYNDPSSGGKVDYCKEVKDQPIPIVKSIEWIPYVPSGFESTCSGVTSKAKGLETFRLNRFGIRVTINRLFSEYDSTYEYNLSLNPNDSDYIYNILSSSPETGSTPLYVEAVYESSLDACSNIAVASGASAITELCSYTFVEKTKNGAAFVFTKDEDAGKNFYGLCDNTCEFKYSIDGGEYRDEDEFLDYVRGIASGKCGIKDIEIYNYDIFNEDEFYEISEFIRVKLCQDYNPNMPLVDIFMGHRPPFDESKESFVVFYRHIVDEVEENCKYNDYMDAYRPAQTPWFVSEAHASTSGTGSAATTTVKMKKLFKFFTISDGNSANYQVKVSIQRLNPKLGTFDVLVRDFNDTDRNPLILEKFSNCTLNKGDESYLPFKIGSFDGGYVSKSKYITVLMGDDEDVDGNIPCGYLGYPMPDYNTGNKVFVNYNRTFDPMERVRNQYFGLNEKNIDEDILKYKGSKFYDNDTYDDNPEGTTAGFHMDGILAMSSSATTFVNGKSGYTFASVSNEKVSKATSIPRIINDDNYLKNTIYGDEKVRKYTCYFYGGFDGWDINRGVRTNTDAYKATSYAVSGSTVFKTFERDNYINAETFNLPETAITSDYYAYLAGYRMFSNPQDIDINLFATPGIDWYNHKLLTIDAIEMIEDPEDGRGGDALYVMNAPKYVYTDKNELPYEISIDEMTDYFANDSDINTSYACTYYPWVMYYDSSNKVYLSLPVTKDVVRNMAETDNNDAPWFAPAGLLRGGVDCVKADMKTTLQTEDDLYMNSINPVKSFSKDGVRVWGNKTAYFADSPLNRVNVRRLMIRVKKLVTDAARHLIFEQYTDTLEKQFRGLIEPILAEVKSKRGIYDYRIKTESTPETRDQHILPARILIKPVSALEYISISFVVYPENVEFDEN